MKSLGGAFLGTAVLTFGLAIVPAIAQPRAMAGSGMESMKPAAAHPRSTMGPMSGDGTADRAFDGDMNLVRDLVHSNEQIIRTVTNLPDGIRTVTESANPRVAQSIKAHVASMIQRLNDGKEFNLFSRTIPVLFANRDRIRTAVEVTDNGTVVTQTSSDAAVVAALQSHATEVDELVRDGMVAMMRNMRGNMGMMRGGTGFTR